MVYTFYNMPSSKRSSQLLASVVVIALIAFTFLLIFNTGFFQWPIGSLLGQQQGGNVVATSTVQPGLLIITTQGLRTSGDGFTANHSILLTPFVNSTTGLVELPPLPMGNVTLSIGLQGSLARPQIAQTDPSDGQFSEYLSPGTYIVRVIDGRFGNLSVVVQVNEGTTTELTALVNETDYMISSFNLVDSSSSGWFGGWQQVYGQVKTNGTIPAGVGVNTYVGISNRASQFSECEVCLPIQTDTPNLIGASILASSQSSTSQWIQIHLVQLQRVEGVSSLMLVTQHVSYTVKSIVG